MSMIMRDFPTFHLDTNQSQGTTLLLKTMDFVVSEQDSKIYPKSM